MPYRAAILTAVSDPQQATDDHYSLGVQLSMCQQACERLDAQIVATVEIPGHSRHYDYLEDLEGDCEEYAELTAMVRRECINLIVVYKLDRLWRERGIAIDMERLCKRHAVRIYSCMEPIPLDESGDMMWRMLSSNSAIMASNEIDTFVKRSRDGKYGRAKAGLHLSWVNPPYGYMIDGDNGRPLVPDSATAPYVRKLGELRAKGAGYYSLVNYLADAGAPTYRDKPWQTRTVDRMVHNVFYGGVVRYTRYDRQARKVLWTEDFPGKHEALWTGKVWEGVQRINRQHARDYTGSRRSEPFLLTGFLRCYHCGQSVTYRDNPRRRLFVQCSTYVTTGGKECRSFTRRASDLHTFVKRQIRELIDRPDLYDARRQAPTHEDRIVDLQALIAATTARQQRLYDALESGRFPLDEFSKRQDRLQRQIGQAQDELDDLLKRDGRAMRTKQELVQLHDALSLLDSYSDMQWRLVCKRLIARIYVGADDPIIVWL